MAAARAAAYGVASRPSEEARTHGCLRTKNGGERFEGGFLHKILRGPRWHHPPSTPHYLHHTFPKLTYSKGSQHHHAYPPGPPVDVQGSKSDKAFLSTDCIGRR
jgi:hypothetical protein